MGWDVVQIGLRHDLPVHDPFATAKEVAKRMKQNIRLFYRNEYEYDIEKNVVSEAEGYELIELGKFEVNSSKDYLRMIVWGYQEKLIMDLAGIEKLRKATFADEHAKSMLNDLEEPFDCYEIDNDEESLNIWIHKENVNLDVDVVSRWHFFEKAFHIDSEREWLHNCRMLIYRHAKLFGCDEVIICSDQGPTEYIYDSADLPADELMEYARSLQYLKGNGWLRKSEKEWEKHAKHIMFSSVFQSDFNLSEEDFVEVIYDDFSDIDNL